MAEALVHCHRVGILHLDVKPDNFLIFHNPEFEFDATNSDRQFRTKLADFGLARKVKAPDKLDNQNDKTGSKLNTTNTITTQIQCPTVLVNPDRNKILHCQPYTEGTRNLNTGRTQLKLKNRIGTARFMAPELFASQAKLRTPARAGRFRKKN